MRMDAHGDAADPWSNGQDYEQYVGRWSNAVAREFVPWLGADEGGSWLDVGCGTGALTDAILRQAEPTRLHGIDRSEPYLELARLRLSGTIASFETGDAMTLDDGATTENPTAYDVVCSGLVLNFLTGAATSLGQQVNLTTPGGIVGAYVWDYAIGMHLIRLFWEAAMDRDPSAQERAESALFADWQPNRLERMFTDAGLTGIESREIVVPTVFHSFDDVWAPFLGGQGPAPVYLRSIGPEAAQEVRGFLERRVPVADDGSVSLTARAWAVKGLKRWPLRQE
jgi:SAM-dependent methyltransferase